MADHSADVTEYGAWPSAISAADVARAGVRLGQCTWHAGRLWWVEGRPEEAGRSVIVSLGDDETVPREELPAGYDARSAVHEYGGGAFCVGAPGLAFVNAADQAVYLLPPGGAAIRLTPADEQASYADLQLDEARGRLLAIREDHAARTEARASLVAIDLAARVPTRELAAGPDFLASPRLSPDGRQLVWLAWRHPDMPWDASELWSATLTEAGDPLAVRQLAGDNDSSLFHPLFGPDGHLYVASDASGWWNICRVEPDGRLTAITSEQAEFGQPQWMFGQSTFGFDAYGRLFAICCRNGQWQLVSRSDASAGLTVIDLPFTHLEQLRVGDGMLAFIGGHAGEAPTLCRMNFDGSGLQRLRAAGQLDCDPALLSRPTPLAYPTANGETAHGFFYAPRNPNVTAPPDRPPPLLIKCHGGPTGATITALDPRIQFWTSRGFAVLDVNYRGSAGYGRAYRRRLYGQWGIADVQDCEHGVQYLVERSLVDPARVVISGSSAGGYTVLCVLTWSDVAAAGTSYYGIGDLQRLLESTHKFESRYLGRLISDDPADYRARSPLYHAERIACPVLFLQGGRDRVVPPDQSQTMVDALQRRGLPTAQIVFPEERHGFRDAANLTRALEAELAFYGQVLGFSPADPLDVPAIRAMYSAEASG